jgi:hypothetical protein
MTTPQIRIIDGDTIIDRDMNAEELAVHEAIMNETKELEKAAKAKSKARDAVLAKLGLTDDELSALLS